jgi:hypothetical protein
MERQLRRLEGVADVRGDWKSGRVSVRWRGEVPLDLARLKAVLFTWRGGPRFGAAEVAVVGEVVSVAGRPALRLTRTGQIFRLRARGGAEALPAPGTTVRVVGEVSPSRRADGEPDLALTVRAHEIVAETTKGHP